MTEATTRSILRLIAVVTILVGVIMTSTTMVSLIGMRDMAPSMGALTNMGLYVVFAYALIVAWGIGLYAWSPRLAQRIVA